MEREWNLNYKHEYARLLGELSQTNVPYRVQHTIEQRMKTMTKAYNDSHIVNNNLLNPIQLSEVFLR